MPKRIDLTSSEALLLFDVLEQFDEGLTTAQKDMESDGTLKLEDLLVLSATTERQRTIARNLRDKLGMDEHSAV